MEIINISIGGPDYLDLPFADKMIEVLSNGIVVFAATGNDGPYFGTVNHPAEEPSVIGIGGISYKDSVADFSSRGMTLKEFPNGYGRPKPDLMAYSQNVYGLSPSNTCRALSGTSVGSPVATGVAALIASSIPIERRKEILNPASMKQVLLETAQVLNGPSIYVQGAGKIDLEKAITEFQKYEPHEK